MGEKTYSAFFYGTLMTDEILCRVLYYTSYPEKGSQSFALFNKLHIQPAILHDFCRHRLKYYDYPGILPEKGKSVRGTFVDGLRARDIHNLDVFEGGQYTRIPVKVELLDQHGKVVAKDVGAETYEFTSPEPVEPEEWDFEQFRREKMRNWVGSRTREYVDLEFDKDDGPEHDPTGGRAFSPEDDPKELIKHKEEDEALGAAV